MPNFPNIPDIKQYAQIHYLPTLATENEFMGDLTGTARIHRSLRSSKYTPHKVNIRLLINQIITFYNVFEAVAATHLLFARIDEDMHTRLKAVLVLTNRFPSCLDPEYGDIECDESMMSAIQNEIGGYQA